MKSLIAHRTMVILEQIPNADTGKIIGVHLNDDEGNNSEVFRYRVVTKGPGMREQDGTITPVPLEKGDEVVFDRRFAVPLQPEAWYDGRKLVVCDYTAIMATVERSPDEKVSRFHAPQPQPQQRPQIVRAQQVPIALPA